MITLTNWKCAQAFPMTVTGKVRKVQMKEMNIVELGLDADAPVKTT